jgi:hypothetical protein
VELTKKNADAQIGTVSVRGDWIASNLIAGVMANAGGFGNGDDTKILGAVKDNPDLNGAGSVSKIASVIIKGHAIGTLDSADAAIFGIEAQQLGAIKLGGASVPLVTGAGNDTFPQRHPLGPTLGTVPAAGNFDFNAFEVPMN